MVRSAIGLPCSGSAVKSTLAVGALQSDLFGALDLHDHAVLYDGRDGAELESTERRRDAPKRAVVAPRLLHLLELTSLCMLATHRCLLSGGSAALKSGNRGRRPGRSAARRRRCRRSSAAGRRSAPS